MTWARGLSPRYGPSIADRYALTVGWTQPETAETPSIVMPLIVRR